MFYFWGGGTQLTVASATPGQLLLVSKEAEDTLSSVPPWPLLQVPAPVPLSEGLTCVCEMK